MKKLPLAICLLALTAAAVLAALAGSATARPDAGSTAACGFERWSAKTLEDAAARRVDFQPRATTVAALRRLPAPASLPDSRLGGVERHTYRIAARLVAAKVEDDSDIHVVVADPHSGGTMIVEFPALGCTKHATPTARKLMERARVERGTAGHSKDATALASGTCGSQVAAAGRTVRPAAAGG